MLNGCGAGWSQVAGCARGAGKRADAKSGPRWRTAAGSCSRCRGSSAIHSSARSMALPGDRHGGRAASGAAGGVQEQASAGTVAVGTGARGVRGRMGDPHPRGIGDALRPPAACSGSGASRTGQPQAGPLALVVNRVGRRNPGSDAHGMDGRVGCRATAHRGRQPDRLARGGRAVAGHARAGRDPTIGHSIHRRAGSQT